MHVSLKKKEQENLKTLTFLWRKIKDTTFKRGWDFRIFHQINQLTHQMRRFPPAGIS